MLISTVMSGQNKRIPIVFPSCFGPVVSEFTLQKRYGHSMWSAFITAKHFEINQQHLPLLHAVLRLKKYSTYLFLRDDNKNDISFQLNHIRNKYIV